MRKITASVVLLLLLLSAPAAFADCIWGCQESIDYSFCKQPGALYDTCEDRGQCNLGFNIFDETYYWICQYWCETTSNCYEV